MSESTSTDIEKSFAKIAEMIRSAKKRVVQTANTQLVELYWQVGAYISQKLSQAEWGDGVVQQLAEYLARTQPGLRGFTRRNLFRMRKFYETYRDNEEVTALLSQLPWTHNLIIINQSKLLEEREFYLRLAIKEKWSSRELERQFKTALFERTALNSVKVSPVVSQSHPSAMDIFRDAYVLEFLDLPERHTEADLHKEGVAATAEVLLVRVRARLLLCGFRVSSSGWRARFCTRLTIFSSRLELLGSGRTEGRPI